MEDVIYFGYITTDNPNLPVALGDAISTCALDFQQDDRRDPDYDMYVSDEFLSVFPPTRKRRTLSGLWDLLYPGRAQGDVEFAEPNGCLIPTTCGAIFCSNRGSVDTVARLIQLLSRDGDYAALWWQLADADPVAAMVGTIVIEGGNLETRSVQKMTAEPGAGIPAEEAIARLVDDRRRMFDLLFQLTPATSTYRHRSWIGRTW